jgi:hypothetical protein
MAKKSTAKKKSKKTRKSTATSKAKKATPKKNSSVSKKKNSSLNKVSVTKTKRKSTKPFLYSTGYLGVGLMVVSISTVVYFAVTLGGGGTELRAQIDYFEGAEPGTYQEVPRDFSLLPNDDTEGVEQVQGRNFEINLDTTKWKTYRNPRYLFQLQYPHYWEEPQVEERFIPGEEYQFKLSFTRKDPDGKVAGVDVLVYPFAYYEVKDTSPIAVKEFVTKEGVSCPPIDQEVTIGQADYAAKKVLIEENSCYDEAYFFSAHRNGYLYNFVPVPRDGYNYPGYDGEMETAWDIPEFEPMLGTVKFLPKPKPKPTAKKPGGAKKVGNKYVCAGDDATKWSLQNPPGHLDTQCCLDPDETPNPWCSYSAENLAKVAEMKAEGPPDEWEDKWD